MDLVIRMVREKRTLTIRCPYMPEVYGDYMTQASYIVKEFLPLGWKMVHASITL